MKNRLTVAIFTAVFTILFGCGESEAAKQARAEAAYKEIDEKRAAEHKAMLEAIRSIDTGKKSDK